MIIFGTQGSTRTLESGTFYCPECDGERRYERKSVRQNVSLFFVPVIPLAEKGQYIECQSCESTFREEVLDYQPSPKASDIEAEFKRGTRMIMILMMTADGRIEEDEISAIQAIYEKIADSSTTPTQIRNDAKELSSKGNELITFLSDLEPYLNENGKELVLKAAILVATADGNLHAEEKKLITKIGKALGMSTAHVMGVFNELGRPS